MNLKTFLVLLCPLLVVSCGKELLTADPESHPEDLICFTGAIGPSTRATDSDFESGDAIGVFAVEKTASNPNGLLQSSNHADNVKYTYSGGMFKGSTTSIKQITSQTQMFYKAVYPYSTGLKNEFTFTVGTDQSTSSKYTRSDLMTAETGATTSVTPELTFNHKLCNVIVSVCYEEKPSGTANLSFINVKSKVKVNLNEDSFNATGSTTTIKAMPYGTNGFRLVLPPQTILKGTELVRFALGSKTYTLSTDNDLSLKSGFQYTYRLVIRKDGKATMRVSENPWKSEIDIEDIIPRKVLNNIKKHMPIYLGDTPPNVEGSYYLNPYVTAYFSDSDSDPERTLTSQIVNFSNQNENILTVTTLDDGDNTSYYTDGTHITGYGDYFTVFYDLVGDLDLSNGNKLNVRMAEIYSGKITSTGISNLYYAFTFTEKGDDPNDEYIDVGVLRIYKDKDGFSENNSWRPSASSSAPDTRSFRFNTWKTSDFKEFMNITDNN